MKVVINIKIRNEESEYELGPGGWRKIEDKMWSAADVSNYYQRIKAKLGF